MKKTALAIIVLLALGGMYYFLAQSDDPAVNVTNVSKSNSQDKNQDYDEQAEPEEEATYDISATESLQVIVNKDRPIDLNYIPGSLVIPNVGFSGSNVELRSEAATSLEEMFAAAQSEGITLLLGSAYRSSATQSEIYNNYVAQFGQEEADRFSARPGTSEHQLGLAADISSQTGECFLETCFANTVEGKWLAQNAHTYGFVVRYPEGKESITGYQFEPWHLRFFGTELAAELKATNQTAEEYFSL